jgi:YebC/PmpR family DNA-binding regulatory protein
MSGHSHWAGIKHRKGINDAKRAKIFTKHGKIITIAAREGGGDPETNFKLRLEIDRARFENMPKENIERAIKRGTGELKDGAQIEEVIYEAYGPGQVAMLIKTATDSKNRTLGEIKTILTKNGGKGVPAGSVSFLFKLMGGISVSSEENMDQYEMEMKAIEAGAEDTNYADSILTLYVKSEELQRVKENLESRGLKIESAGLVYVPLQKAVISEEEQKSYEKLLELLDDQDDVQEIYDNL